MTKRNPECKTMNILINPKLKDEFYIKAIQNQTTMAHVMRDMIRKYVKEN